MEIEKGIEIIDLGLYLKKYETLIISDLHLGYEELLKEEGYLFPLNQYKDLIERLKKIIDKVKIERIIINGDLKHDFGSILRSEWKGVLDILDFLKDKEVIIIKGNHDKMIEPIANKKGIKVVNRFDIDNITIIHGDIIPIELKEIVIIGHEHPAISFKDKPYEKFKVFLKGKFGKSKLIVMPSFNLIFPGTDIRKDKLLSPFLGKDISEFEVFIVEDKVYNFGKVKKNL
ncbi:MAG: metallophosphoesterase [Candidatus Nanoarchaeia archaeon]|nr:metallophosphoesterase [Candidatus Nanoarchaeia archaeon]